MTQKRATALLLLALVLAGFSACRNQPVTRFPHTRHLVELECGGPGQPDCLGCASCHSGVQDPRRAAQPGAEACQACHQNGEQLLAQMKVDSGWSETRGTGIIFPHGRHLELDAFKGQCVNCHAGVIESSDSEQRFPTMARCLECHQDQFDAARCTPCHRAADLSRLVPQSFLRHDAAWPHAHGVEARRQQQVCTQCHTEKQCADCHDTGQSIPIEKRRPEAIESHQGHRADFLTRHALEARSQQATCLRCHTPRSCDACHVRRGVSAARVGSVNPHPIGWLGSDTSSRDFHGRAARRDLVSCAACHDHGAATNCIRCHQVGGPGGNPHPRGWDSGRSTSQALCRYCHDS